MRFLIAPLALIAVMCLGPLAMPALALAQGQPVQGKIDVDIKQTAAVAGRGGPVRSGLPSASSRSYC
jgi:hypothetical protein